MGVPPGRGPSPSSKGPVQMPTCVTLMDTHSSLINKAKRRNKQLVSCMTTVLTRHSRLDPELRPGSGFRSAGKSSRVHRFTGDEFQDLHGAWLQDPGAARLHTARQLLTAQTQQCAHTLGTSHSTRFYVKTRGLVAAKAEKQLNAPATATQQ